jgi:hypothetical protein
LEPSVFEYEWNKIISEFGLQNNTWLAELYNIREKWIPAYLRDEPLAGLMRTTSRSECENYFFGKLCTPYLTLVEFLSHFDTCIDTQRYILKRNDHDSKYTVPTFKTPHQFEKEAAELYTQTIFYDVQHEIYSSSFDCYVINREICQFSTKYFICDTEVEKIKSSQNINFIFEVCFLLYEIFSLHLI